MSSQSQILIMGIHLNHQKMAVAYGHIPLLSSQVFVCRQQKLAAVVTPGHHSSQLKSCTLDRQYLTLGAAITGAYGGLEGRMW